MQNIHIRDETKLDYLNKVFVSQMMPLVAWLISFAFILKNRRF